MIEDYGDFGKAGDDRLDGGQQGGRAVDLEAGTYVPGALPDGILVRGGPLGRVVGTGQVQAQAAEAVLLDQLLELVRGVRGVAVDQADAGESAWEAAQAVDHVAVVVQVVDGLDDDGPVDAGFFHGLLKQFDRGAFGRLAALGKGIALEVVAPDVQVSVDDHRIPFVETY